MKSFLLTLLGLLFVVAVVIFLNYPNQPATQYPVVVTAESLYQCAQGHTMRAVFSKQGPVPAALPGQPPVSNASVALSLDGASEINLPQTISADGVRYANADESLVFWSKGAGATLQENGQSATFQDCIVVKADVGDLPQVYLDQGNHFTVRYPAGYTVDENYSYQNLAPGVTSSGVQFTIASELALGTNLSPDSYISIESRSDLSQCTATDFLSVPDGVKSQRIVGDHFTYSFASSTDAGVGNRYAEYVYALADSNPCLAIRYFIHSTAIENYDPGVVTEFDQAALLNEFDAIRRSLTLDAPLVPALRLTADAYPLYPELHWRAVEAKKFADLEGYQVQADPLQDITDIASSTQPFVAYYADLLTSKGWQEDISRAAGGPGSAVIAYQKADDYIVLQYKSDFSISKPDQPAQCPCAVEFSVFSGS